MLYLLSKVLPVPMRSTYQLVDDGCNCDACEARRNPVEHATWWQFRGRIFRHRRTRLA